MTVRLRPAEASDLSRMHGLLRAVDLPVAGVGPDLARYRVACDPAGRVVGIVGIEMHAPDALLRSLVVDPAARGAGVAARLVDAATAMARDAGASDMYLLTTDAAGYFAQRGFLVTDRERAPAAIRASDEFRTLCPGTATLMRLQADPVR